jgi:plasmid stabilization system protein ParE
MTYEIKISSEADQEADEVYEWIARDSLRNASRWYLGLIDAIQTLSENPQRCPLAPDDGAFDDEVRQLLYGKRKGVYRILFTISSDAVHILKIRHGARKYLGESGGNQ